ncbi:MAG TPA: hypothetical protein VF183_10160 [Acidimicrobiales bacterium]
MTERRFLEAYAHLFPSWNKLIEHKGCVAVRWDALGTGVIAFVCEEPVWRTETQSKIETTRIVIHMPGPGIWQYVPDFINGRGKRQAPYSFLGASVYSLGDGKTFARVFTDAPLAPKLPTDFVEKVDQLVARVWRDVRDSDQEARP